jgi:hypothetical protein
MPDARDYVTPPLDNARQLAELTVDQLWMRYFALGGAASVGGLTDYLHDVNAPDVHQYDIVVHALNERFGELEMGSPVEYCRP